MTSTGEIRSPMGGVNFNPQYCEFWHSTQKCVLPEEVDNCFEEKFGVSLSVIYFLLYYSLPFTSILNFASIISNLRCKLQKPKAEQYMNGTSLCAIKNGQTESSRLHCIKKKSEMQ
jgi:hypothetical protein